MEWPDPGTGGEPPPAKKFKTEEEEEPEQDPHQQQPHPGGWQDPMVGGNSADAASQIAAAAAMGSMSAGSGAAPGAVMPGYGSGGHHMMYRGQPTMGGPPPGHPPPPPPHGYGEQPMPSPYSMSGGYGGDRQPQGQMQPVDKQGRFSWLAGEQAQQQEQHVPIAMRPPPPSAGQEPATAIDTAISAVVAETVAHVSNKDTKPAPIRLSVTPTVRKGPKKKMKRKPSTMTTKSARKLLLANTDLGIMLDERDCMLLANVFWIFSAEQLKAAFDLPEFVKKLEDALAGRIPIAPGAPPIYSEIIKEANAKLEAPIIKAPPPGQLVHFPPQQPTMPSNDVIAAAATAVNAVTNASRNAALQGLAQMSATPVHGMSMGQASAYPPAAQPPAASMPQAGGAPSMEVEDEKPSAEESKRTETAAELIEKWKGLLNKGAPAQKIEEKFPLSGAIRVLFPKSSQLFLKSLSVFSLWKYLTLRKSENAPICSLFMKWRHACGLMEPISGYAISKHFVCIVSRIEIALGAIPYLEEGKRIYVKDAMNAMTGASRDFLVETHKIYSIRDFISIRTKELSLLLEAWRTANDLEPLKGSGKVAMISAWKTFGKEVLQCDLETGRVISLEEHNIENTLGHDFTPGTPKRVRAKKPPKDKTSLYTKGFLSQLLGSEVAILVQKAGIEHAHDLLNADSKASTSPLFGVLVEAGKVESVQSFHDLLASWRKTVSAKLDEERAKLEEEAAAARAAKERASPPRPKRNPAPRAIKTDDTTQDAIESLSLLSRTFLETIGITTGLEFLSTRSTDIAQQFKDWRESEGKPELKGLGAIASVSGWKSQVRKKAREMGLVELSELEPWTSGGEGRRIRKVKRAKKPRIQIKEEELEDSDTEIEVEVEEDEDEILDEESTEEEDEDMYLPVSGEEVTFVPSKGLNADGRHVFAVQSQGSAGQFVFELSKRKRTDADDEVLFATYKGFGSGKAESEPAMRIELESYPVEADQEKVQRPVWLLVDVEVGYESKKDVRAPFSAWRTGGGLIDVGRNGALPYKKQNLDKFKEIVRSFVVDGKVSGSALPEGNCEDKANVLIQKIGFESYRYMLYLAKPMEKGQTVPLEFPSIEAVICSKKYSDSEFGVLHAIDEATRTLCVDDIRGLTKWLRDDLKKGDSLSESLLEDLDKKRRLYWVSRRLFAAIGSHRETDDDKQACEEIYAGLCSAEAGQQWPQLSEAQQTQARSSLVPEIKREILYGLDLDLKCGTARRPEWCERARVLLDAVVNVLSTWYTNVLTPDKSSLGEALLREMEQAIKHSESDGLGDFVFQLSSGKTGRSMVLTGVAKRLRTAYNQAMILVGESAQQFDTPQILDVVACKSDSNSDSSRAIMRRPSEAVAGKGVVSSSWYGGLFWQIVYSAIASFNFHLSPSEAGKLDAEKVLQFMRVQFSVDLGSESPQAIAYKQSLPIPTQQTDYTPNSYHFFLGVVWPSMAKLGWRLVVGSKQSELLFCPGIRPKKRTGYAKYQRDRKRAKITGDVNSMGYGQLQKSTKRFLVATTSGKSKVPSGGAAASEIFSKFQKYLEARVLEVDGTLDASKKNIADVVQAISSCFEKTAPSIMALDPSVAGDGSQTFDQGPHLMQFLLVLPRLLRTSDLRNQDVETTLAAAEELVKFIENNKGTLLPESCSPEPEEYDGPDGTPLRSQLIEELSTKTAEPVVAEAVVKEEVQDVEMGEADQDEETKANEDLVIVRDSDRKDLTEFICTVMDQAKLFRATPQDVEKKNGRVVLGAPGLVCMHCNGRKYEGRYFFANVESLTACYTVLEKHFLKCAVTPQEVKDKLIETRQTHAMERKSLPPQQAFFSNLWRRMRRSKASLPAIDPEEDDNVKEEEAVRRVDASDSEDFADYMPLLDLMRKNKNAGVQSALDRYYACLEYGGRVYHTPAEPQNFSPEWLLAKIVPKNPSGTKTTFLTG